MRTPPPQPELVYVDEDRAIALRWDAPGADQHRYYAWLASACEHGPLGRLVSHRLGNMAGIAFLRTLFNQQPERFPVLLRRRLSEMNDLIRASRAVNKPIVF
jgi:hypothetical protein